MPISNKGEAKRQEASGEGSPLFRGLWVTPKVRGAGPYYKN